MSHHAAGNRWSEDMTVKFVLLYRDRPCLWDTGHEHYKSREMRNRALTTLVEEMRIEGFSTMICKLKIKNLRSHYCQELRRIQNSKLRKDPAPYKPTLVWFPIINGYLRKHVHQTFLEDEESTNGDDVTSDAAVADAEPSTESQLIVVKQEPASPPDYSSVMVKQEATLDIEYEAPSDYEPSEEEQEEEDEYQTDDEPPQSKRKRLSTTTKKHVEPKKNAKSNSSSEHEFDLFCKGIAKQLKNMPLENALKLQMNILSTVTQERIKCLKKIKKN